MPAAEGLTAQEVAERVARGQVNDVPAVPSRTVGQIVRANVFTRFNALLGSLLVVTLFVGPIQDALFGFVLIANAGVGIYQELRAKRTLDTLAVLTSPHARIVRDGQVRELPLTEVVLDDVLELQPGDQIVVDGEMLEAAALEVDESLLTGEAEPVVKSPADEVLSGSFVAAGSGRFRATRVGAHAYAAQLAEQGRRFSLTRSELRSGIDQILRIVTWLLIPTAALLVFSQLRSNASLRGAILGSVAGTVAMVPEGLVLLTSVAFALGVVRLARRRVLVQELPAVEVLARVDVLCIDKTGTLTEGRLVVDEVELLGEDGVHRDALAALAAAEPHPNATLLAIRESFPDPGEGWLAARTVPFSSARKWSGADFGTKGTWVLGAPDVLLGSRPGDDAQLMKARRHAEAGRRVVLLGRTDAPIEADAGPVGLVPVAYVILTDRVRETASATLAYFARQGVDVKVISGDHPQTVSAVARRVGLPGAEAPFDAKALPEGGRELADVLETHAIFGRVTPQQKRAMVEALQSRGRVVAMTGDGVNDVLALKDADIGVAMGSGSSATRAVAQLVLLDSTFDALPSVVGEGRRVLGNIERTSNLYVTKTVYAMLIALGVGVVGLEFPFLPRQLTLIGALTIGIPSFFLALAPNDERARPGFLPRVLRFTIPAGSLAAIATFLGYVLVKHEPGITLAEARTAATMVLLYIGFLVLTIIAAPLNTWRLALVWAMPALFGLAMAIPAAREFFALYPPPLIVWLAAFGIAALVWSFARLFLPPERPVGPGAPPAPV
ncbi:MAG TPA: HAD-IC family P-type ATPase [Actinomycetota bacterium]|nr:HAD-IC family P-type ATPase [Actinomycetota bacterium]